MRYLRVRIVPRPDKGNVEKARRPCIFWCPPEGARNALAALLPVGTPDFACAATALASMLVAVMQVGQMVVVVFQRFVRVLVSMARRRRQSGMRVVVMPVVVRVSVSMRHRLMAMHVPVLAAEEHADCAGENAGGNQFDRRRRLVKHEQ